jgi:16S rRNA (guanine966-N2)-methyltransferase
MLRVISGTAGGIFLQAAKGPDVRPTQDRVKQSLFSSLGDLVVNADVLDLYAGTGALGIECLSRGAESATFVEQNSKCAQAIRENLKKCHLTGGVSTQPVEKWITQNQNRAFDLIFVDPPYHQWEEALHLHPFWTHAKTLLKPDGIILFEHFFKKPLQLDPPYSIVHQKTYGDTQISWVRLIPPTPPTS